MKRLSGFKKWFRYLRVSELRDDRLQAAKAEAEQAKRSKSELLASISHEIRTPMNSILTMATLLRRSNPRPDQIGYCDAIDHAGRTLLRIIEEMLELSRAESGKLFVDHSAFDLARTIREVSDMIAPSVAVGVTFGASIEETLPKYLRGDAGKIQQVLLNLLGNASRFTDFGEVRLRVFPVSSAGQQIRVRFEVSDTGVGIPDEAFGRLFIPFSQVSPQSAKEKMGTGLGLAISRRFVEAMGGTIGVQSRFGFGSTFSFEVPLYLADDREIAFDREAVLSELAFEGKVLVVDDNEANIHVTTALLTDIGLAVDSASSGFEALEKTGHHAYDIVFLDCQMPGLDGFETAKRIRNRETWSRKRLPIVALTAYASREVADRCRASGMDDFLAKPIDLDEVSEVIGRFLTPTARVPKPEKVTSPSADASGKSVDLQALNRLLTMNPPRGEFESSDDVIDELIRLYKKSTAKMLKRLREIQVGGTPKELAECAHFLKSSSMSVGAVRVTAELQRLEAFRGAGELPPNIGELIDGLAVECENALSEIESWWRKNKIERGSFQNAAPSR